MGNLPETIERPDFDGVVRFWTELLQSRGLPTNFRWIFYEDYARLKSGFAFRLRPQAEADRIARELGTVDLAALEQLFLPGFELGGGGYYTLRGNDARLNRGLYRTSYADCTNVTSRLTKFDDVEWQRIRRDGR